MTRIRRLRACLYFLTLSLLASFGPQAQAQFHVMPGEVMDTVSVIAVLPSVVPPDVEGAETVAAKIDAELAKALTNAGFKVVGADVYKSIENEYSIVAGGFFDPFTGEVKEGVRAAVINRAVAALLARHGVNGFIRAGIVTRQVTFKDAKKIEWDGVFEDVIAKQGLWASLDRSLGIRDEGSINVVSLHADVYNDRGGVIFRSSGGIAATSALANKVFVPVDLPAVLNDAGRLQRAAEVLTWPMTHKGNTELKRQFSGTGDGKPTFRSTLPLAEAEALPASLPAAQIRQQVMTVALARIDATGHPRAEQVSALYEKQLSQALSKAGFRVLPSETYAQASDDAAREVGGIYDALTGKLVPEKAEAVRAALRRRLQDEHAVDAILTPAFEVISAPYDLSGDAKWDGVTQSVFKTAAGWNGKPYTGKQPALSLEVRLEDMSTRNLYAGRGGIELTALFINGGFDRQPQEQLLLDETKSARAIGIALAGIGGASDPAAGGN